MAKRGKQSHYARRLEQVNTLIQLGFYGSAVSSASIGIELLMQELYDALRKKLISQGHNAKAFNLQTACDRYTKNGTASGPSTFSQWMNFYARENLLHELKKGFGYNFDHFHMAQLYKIRKLRNKCSHAQETQTDYQPSRNEAEFVCNHLALFLEETKRAPATRQDHEWTKDWHKEWDGRIRMWRARNRNSLEADIVSALADQLRLAVDLINHGQVPGKLKTQLMQAVTYVIEPDDLIEDKNVDHLVDDAAVLAFTFYWLNNTSIIEPAVLHEHWVGEGDPIEVTIDLCRHISKNHKKLFSDEAWAIIGAIAEKGPRVLWQMPK